MKKWLNSAWQWLKKEYKKLSLLFAAVYVIVKLNNQTKFLELDWFIAISQFIEHDLFLEVALTLCFIAYWILSERLKVFALWRYSECLIWLLYAYHRCIDPESSHFLHYYWLPFLNYLDFILLIPIPFDKLKTTVFKFLERNKVDKSQNLLKTTYPPPVQHDTPLESKSDLSKSRQKHLEYIKQKIASIKPGSDSYSIGIAAKWGEGKTSFLKALKSEIQGDKYIFIDFNPWKKPDTQRFFFDTLINGLGDLYSIKLKVSTYLNTLESLDKNGVLRAIWRIIKINQSHQSEYDDVSQALAELDKQIIIIIDDIDRLYSNEVAEVLKLIRNTASFKNTIFISAYDRAYLDQAIAKSVSSYGYENYAEKIFDEEIALPLVKREALDFLMSNLANSLDFSGNQLIILLGEGSKIASEINTYFITNLRDAKRFLNSYEPMLKRLKDDLDIENLLLIQLIHFKFKALYIELRSKRLFDDNDNSTHKIDEKKLSLFLDNYYLAIKEDLKIVVNYLFAIHRVKTNSIAQKNYFNDYFQGYIETRPLRKEMHELLNYKEIKETASQYYESFQDNFLSSLDDVVQDENLNASQYLNYIYIFVLYYKGGIFTETKILNSIFRLEHKSIQQSKKTLHKPKVIEHLKLNNRFHSLIKELISEFIYKEQGKELQGSRIGNIIFTKEELQEINLHYFREYTRRHEDDIKYEKLKSLLYACEKSMNKRQAVIILDEALNEMRALLNKENIFYLYLNNFFYFSWEPRPNAKNTEVSFEPLCIRIFANNDRRGGYTNFKEFVSKSSYSHKGIILKGLEAFEDYLKEHNQTIADAENPETPNEISFLINEPPEKFFGRDYMEVNIYLSAYNSRRQNQ